MGVNVLTAAFVKYETKIYGYSPEIYGHTGFLNGQPLVDCSQLVYDGLVDAGYDLGVSVGNFSTHTLFNGDAFTSVADTNFTKLSGADVQQKNGSLQMGDIICFHSIDPKGKDSNGNPTYSQHVGIFYGYNADGNPMFYGSQSSTGPDLVTIDVSRTSYWNGGTEIIVGALRPLESIHTGFDSTLALTQSTGHGKNIPGQIPDPTATYRKVYGTDGDVMLFYSTGEIFTYSKNQEIWRIPSQSGGATTISRYVYASGTPQAHYGKWSTTEYRPDGTSYSPIAHFIALAGAESGNPFLDPVSAQDYALAAATGSSLSLTNQATANPTGATQTFTIYASGASSLDQTIELTLQGNCSQQIRLHRRRHDRLRRQWQSHRHHPSRPRPPHHQHAG